MNPSLSTQLYEHLNVIFRGPTERELKPSKVMILAFCLFKIKKKKLLFNRKLKLRKHSKLIIRGIIQGSHVSNVLPIPVRPSPRHTRTLHPFCSPSLSLSPSLSPRNSSQSIPYFTNAFPSVPRLIVLRKSNQNLGNLI